MVTHSLPLDIIIVITVETIIIAIIAININIIITAIINTFTKIIMIILIKSTLTEQTHLQASQQWEDLRGPPPLHLCNVMASMLLVLLMMMMIMP